MTGVTYSPTFAITTDGFQQTPAGGVGDAFIVMLDSSGAVGYGTYLGGDGWDQGQAIAVDAAGNVYVAGATNSSSTTLPLTSPLQALYGGGGYDAFVAKLAPRTTSGYNIQYLSYLGGSDRDLAFGVAADSGGNAYVVGETMSTDFPVATSLQSTWFGGGRNRWGDAFISKITASGLLSWSTYLGGGDDDWAYGVAVDGNQGIYVSGSSLSTDFPMETPYQAVSAGNGDAMLFKLTDSPITADLQVSVSATPDLVGSGETLTYRVVVNNLSTSNVAGGVRVLATLPNGISFKSATPAGICTASGVQVACNVGSIAAGGSAEINLNTVSNTAGDITFTAKLVRANQPDPNSANNNASVTVTAAAGTGGGGLWSPMEWLLVVPALLLMRRRGFSLLS